jgi:hypothetical protein
MDYAILGRDPRFESLKHPVTFLDVVGFCDYPIFYTSIDNPCFTLKALCARLENTLTTWNPNYFTPRGANEDKVLNFFAHIQNDFQVHVGKF